ncbi:MAG: hypothetical protein R3C97_10485 [Geminicoccaceae bacterium]
MRLNWSREYVGHVGEPIGDDPAYSGSEGQSGEEMVICAHRIPFRLLYRELENDELRFFTRLLHRAAQIQSNFACEDVFQFSDAATTRAEDIVNLYDMALALLRDEARNAVLDGSAGGNGESATG